MPDSVHYQIIEELALLNRNFLSDDYDRSLDYLHSLLPLEIIEFSSGTRYNSWEIPPHWDLEEAWIRDSSGKEIFRANHPLHVIGLSREFQGMVPKEELLTHLHYDHRDPTWIPYHFRQNYRPWDRDWGFCVSKTFIDGLQDDRYEVSIRTREKEGPLKVARYRHEGSSPIEFAFVAHLDHPGMANDDLAGVAVGVELFRRLKKKETKFSYQLVLLQEIIGSEYYLGLKPEESSSVLEACFLESLGSNTPLALQASRKGVSLLELSIKESLQSRKQDFREGSFRSIIGNDELVWESYKIPMCSLSRFPYREYHSDQDNLSIISKEALEASTDALMGAIEILEREPLLRKTFQGTPCLSHPDLDLYVDPGQRAFGDRPDPLVQKHRKLMDLIPAVEGPTFVRDLSEKVDLPLEEVLKVLNAWEAKGLLELN